MNRRNFVSPVYFEDQLVDPADPYIYIGEEWRPITEDVVPNIRPNYIISSCGRVYNIRRKHFLHYHIAGRGYYYVRLSLKDGSNNISFLVHRLVMLTFNYNPNHKNLQINHITGNKAIFGVGWLEWATQSENMLHAYEYDLNHKGEDHYSAIFTNEQVHTICQCIENGLKYKEIANVLGLEFTDRLNKAISEIKTGRRWRHISSKYNF